MSIELREICRMIHVMSPNPKINWSRGVEDGEAKIKNKNVRRKFEILKYIEEHSDVKKKDVAEKFTISTKTLSDVNVIKAEEKIMQALASGSSACAEEIMVLATRIETLLIREMTKRLNQATILLFFLQWKLSLKVSSYLLFLSSATSENT